MIETKGDRMKIWNALRTPPESALKEIKGGRLSGMTDIRPQWRLQAMTEQFGPCGIGWTFTIHEQKEFPAGPDGEVVAHTVVSIKFQVDGKWSEPVYGTGGSMLVAKERNGLYVSDEAFKMSLTDALSVAMKNIGVAADIYMGQGRKPPPQNKVDAEELERKQRQIRHKEDGMKNMIWRLCQEMAYGDEQTAKDILYDVAHVRDPERLDKYTYDNLKRAFAKTKKTKEEWDARQQVDQEKTDDQGKLY